MRRAAAIASVTVLLGITGSAVQERQQPRLQSGAPLVSIDVYPTKSGRLVAGLTRDEFEVLEDGTPQSIDSVEFIRFPSASDPLAFSDTPSESPLLPADPHSRVFAVYLDLPHIAPARLSPLSRDLAEALAHVTGARDLVAIAAPSFSELSFESGIEAVHSRLRAAMASATDDEDERRLQRCFPEDVARSLTDLRRRDRQYRDLETLVTKLALLRDVRSHVLIVSEGIGVSRPAMRVIDPRTLKPLPAETGTQAMASRPARMSDETRACLLELARIADLDFAQRWRALQESAIHAGVVFDTINPASSPGAARPSAASANLRTLAQSTSGRSFEGRLRPAVESIAGDWSGLYWLRYYTTNAARDGTIRKVSVAVRDRSISVKARSQYRAALDADFGAESDRDSPAARSAVDAALELMSARLDQQGLSAYARVLAGRVDVVAEVTTGLASRLTGETEIEAIVSGTDGATAGHARARMPAGSTSLLLRIPIDTGREPGEALVRLHGGIGSVVSSSGIQRTRGGSIGQPLLYRMPRKPEVSWIPVARFEFARTERLRAEWPAGDTTEGFECQLMDRNGKLLPIPLEVSDHGAPELATIYVEVPLTALATGDYVLALISRAKGTAARAYVAFRVTP
jgi:VWFA-related protein